MKWMDKHITTASVNLLSVQATVLYIGWDETGANIVRASTCLNEVRKALEGYAETLQENNND